MCIRSPERIHLDMWNFVSFDQHLPISPSPQTLKATISPFASMNFDSFRCLICDAMQCFAFYDWLITLFSAFNHLIANSRIFSFFRMNCILVCVCCVVLCMCITFALTVHSSPEILFVSIIWLMWVMLQWTWDCRYCFKILIPFPLHI